LAQAEQICLKARRGLKTAEDAVSAVRIKINQSEASLYGGKIHNPKELQGIQTEISSLKKRLAVLEDEQLEAMLAVEEAEAGQTKSQEDLVKTKADVAGQQASLLGEQGQITRTAEKLQTMRAMAAASILPENLQIYERLRKAKRGLAVSKIDDNACTVCGSPVRPAEFQAAHASQQMGYCGTCGRILYSG
jgi:predicted  nucleic acid-binding Zn-ribbon protein